MKRDLVIGSLATLAVSVIGSVIVYYVTKEPELKSHEQLTYRTRSSGHFEGDKQQVAFTSVDIFNRGGRAASNVLVDISFDGDVIKDLSVNTLPGLRASSNVTGKDVNLVYRKLLPGESITVDLLLSRPAAPKVQIRSDESLAVNDGQILSENAGKKGDANKVSALLVPTSAFFFAVIGLLFLRRIRRYTVQDTNNAGFLLLHNGLTDDADEILGSSIRRGRYDAFTLSNLALCKAVKGELDKAKALIGAAKFNKNVGHAAAVVAFNEAITQLLSGNRQDGLNLLRQAIASSPKHIRRYCSLSVHMAQYRSDPEIAVLLKDPK